MNNEEKQRRIVYPELTMEQRKRKLDTIFRHVRNVYSNGEEYNHEPECYAYMTDDYLCICDAVNKAYERGFKDAKSGNQ